MPLLDILFGYCEGNSIATFRLVFFFVACRAQGLPLLFGRRKTGAGWAKKERKKQLESSMTAHAQGVHQQLHACKTLQEAKLPQAKVAAVIYVFNKAQSRAREGSVDSSCQGCHAFNHCAYARNTVSDDRILLSNTHACLAGTGCLCLAYRLGGLRFRVKA